MFIEIKIKKKDTWAKQDEALRSLQNINLAWNLRTFKKFPWTSSFPQSFARYLDRELSCSTPLLYPAQDSSHAPESRWHSILPGAKVTVFSQVRRVALTLQQIVPRHSIGRNGLQLCVKRTRRRYGQLLPKWRSSVQQQHQLQRGKRVTGKHGLCHS